jgi:WD40 repeat protein
VPRRITSELDLREIFLGCQLYESLILIHKNYNIFSIIFLAMAQFSTLGNVSSFIDRRIEDAEDRLVSSFHMTASGAIVLGVAGTEIRVFNMSGEQIAALEARTKDPVPEATWCFTSNEKYLFSGANDSVISVWDISTW